MTLHIDTDAFCKLGRAGLLLDAIRILGFDVDSCARLPALPYMLRTGRLRAAIGAEAADELIDLAKRFPVLPSGNNEILDRLAAVAEIDPGEAQIFACLHDDSHGMVLSGDKRALREMARVAGMADSLSGRVVVLEAILLDLCGVLGSEVVRERVKSLAGSDRMVEICFSSGVADPREALRSYLNSLAVEVDPLVLWHADLEGDE